MLRSRLPFARVDFFAVLFQLLPPVTYTPINEALWWKAIKISCFSSFVATFSFITSRCERAPVGC
jgi:hypothetical protein